MAFTDQEKQEIKQLIRQTLRESGTPLEGAVERDGFAEGDLVPFIHNDGGTKKAAVIDASKVGTGGAGSQGADGKSAYEIAVENGFEGTEVQWLASLKGAKGDKGDTGDTGATGPQGPQGEQGPKGDTGATGSKGDKGDKGDTGEKGEKGDKGDTGEKGADGTGVAIKASVQECTAIGDGYIDGNGHLQMLIVLPSTFTDCGEIKGPKGDKGDKGDTGEQGPKGDTGATGPKGDKGDTGQTGPKGDTGATGPKGDTGDTGPKGDTGEQGPKGDKGDTGATGPQGPQGEQGPKGDTGATGPQGERGPVGIPDTSNFYTKPEVDGAVSQLRSELNARQLAVGAVQTDSQPTKDSANRLTSGILYDTLGELIATKTFSYNAWEHSSNNDRIKVDIKKGTVFSVFIKGSSKDFQQVILYQNKHEIVANYAGSMGGMFKSTAVEDLDYLGFYLYNTTTKSQTIDIEIRLFASDNSAHMMDLQNINEEVSGFSYVFDMPNYDTTYQENSFKNHPRHICNVSKGQSYTLIIDSSTGVTFSQYSSGETDFLRINLYEDSDVELTQSNESSRRIQCIYAIDKTEMFKPVRKTIRATRNGILAFSCFRIEKGQNVIVSVIPNNQHDTIADDMQRVYAMQYKHPTYGAYGFGWYPAFLSITDVHSSWNALERALSYAEYDCIDAVFLQGDIGESSNALTNYAAKLESLRLGCSKPAIAIPGNHEYEYVANSAYVGLTDDQTTSIFYSSAIVSKNGEVHPTISSKFKNYFYKDVTKNGNTVRIIALYQFEWNSPTNSNGNPLYGDAHGKDVPVYTQEQIDWFVSTLKNTPSSYGVIVLSHCEITLTRPVESEFTIQTEDVEPFARLSNKTFFFSIIDAWARGTSCSVSSDQVTEDGVNHPISVNTSFSGTHTFIANIAGHRHAGGIFKMVNTSGGTSSYPVVLSPCTSSSDYQLSGWFTVNETVNRIMDCLNVYIYDFDHKRLKIARLGSDINAEGQEAKTFVIQL